MSRVDKLQFIFVDTLGTRRIYSPVTIGSPEDENRIADTVRELPYLKYAYFEAHYLIVELVSDFWLTTHDKIIEAFCSTYKWNPENVVVELVHE